MKRISRKNFIKLASGTAVAVAGGGYLASRYAEPKTVSPAMNLEGNIPVISDVDAHSQCRMLVEVKEEKVRHISGDPSDPEGRGHLTLRGTHFRDLLYSPERLTAPLKRTGKRGSGKWKEISWDEALTIIAERLNKTKEKFGAEAIDFHHGHYHSGDIYGNYIPRLANLIGTPNITNPAHVCHLPRVFLEFNIDLGGVYQPDIPNTGCLILWGGNPRATNKPQEITIDDAMKRGMKLIVVDPRRTTYADEAHLHAQLRPGTDGALALGMLHVIIKEKLYDEKFVTEYTTGFDKLIPHVEEYTPERVEKITWVTADTIREMARLYATSRPACISPRNALDQHTNCSGSIRAINALMAITGNLDVKGGNIFTIPVSMAFRDMKLFDKLPPEQAEKKIGAKNVLWSKLSTTWPSAHAPEIWDAILHDDPYPVRAMMVFGANPVLACANSRLVERALRKLDFLAVADHFMSPTAELADMVLPASTFLEQERVVTYDIHADHAWNSTSRIILSQKAVEPVGESLPDWEIICRLGRKMGFEKYFPWKTREEAINYEIRPLGITCDKLRKNPDGMIITVPPILYTKIPGPLGSVIRGVLKLAIFRNYPYIYKKYEGMGFMTPSKKVELYSEKLKEHGFNPLPEYSEPAESPVSRPDLAKRYPFILIAGTKLEAYTHSMMRNIPSLHRHAPENLLEIHPEAARRRRIGNGTVVQVSSPRGCISCRAHLTDAIDPRVVHLYHGYRESNCNVLTDNRAFDPITGSVGMKSLLCNVRRA